MQVREVQISYSAGELGPQITNSGSAVNALRPNWQNIEYSETFKVLLLNRANKLLGVFELSRGGMSSTIVDVRMLFATALKCAAHSVILAHNHPSGNLIPSRADEDITEKIVKAGKLLDINVYDHLILTKDGYLSFSDEGLI